MAAIIKDYRSDATVAVGEAFPNDFGNDGNSNLQESPTMVKICRTPVLARHVFSHRELSEWSGWSGMIPEETVSMTRAEVRQLKKAERKRKRAEKVATALAMLPAPEVERLEIGYAL